MTKTPFIIDGDIFSDHRGNLAFVNDFGFNDIKRFYIIEHPDTEVIRAWQGHTIERKYFYVVQGTFCVAWVKIDNWENPSENLKAEYEILKAEKSRILCVPKGYANGLKALLPNSKIIVFSSLNLEESLNEKIRYESSKWFDWKSIKPDVKKKFIL